MPTQPTPPPPAPETPPKPARPPADPPPPGPDAGVPKPVDEGAIFRALLDAGANAVVAYTAEKRLHAMISEAIAPQLQPLLAEVCRRFDERFDEQGKRFEKRLDEQNRRLDEHDRKLDVIVARLDGLKLLGQIMVGAYALLITVLIAVFGFLFAR